MENFNHTKRDQIVSGTSMHATTRPVSLPLCPVCHLLSRILRMQQEEPQARVTRQEGPQGLQGQRAAPELGLRDGGPRPSEGIGVPRTRVLRLSPETDLCTWALSDRRGQEEGSFEHKLLSQQPAPFTPVFEHTCCRGEFWG